MSISNSNNVKEFTLEEDECHDLIHVSINGIQTLSIKRPIGINKEYPHRFITFGITNDNLCDLLYKHGEIAIKHEYSCDSFLYYDKDSEKTLYTMIDTSVVYLSDLSKKEVEAFVALFGHSDYESSDELLAALEAGDIEYIKNLRNKDIIIFDKYEDQLNEIANISALFGHISIIKYIVEDTNIDSALLMNLLENARESAYDHDYSEIVHYIYEKYPEEFSDYESDSEYYLDSGVDSESESEFEF